MTRAPEPLPEPLPHGAPILGLGIDLCEIDRVAAAIARHAERFAARVFHPAEIRRPPASPAYAEHLAGLFAAKEAAMKALGTGMRGVAFREIAILRRGGPPRLALLGRADERARRMGVRAAHVSITHGKRDAVAVVILLA